MAAGSAHLTGITDATRPSVFEVLSQEGFGNALKPAIFHILKIVAEQNPGEWISKTYRYFDELYLAFDAVIQWHYFLTRGMISQASDGATLSEAFYGLERKWTGSASKLSSIRLSYLVSILSPYVSSKLESLYKSQLEDRDHLNEGADKRAQTDKKKVLEAFLKLYPYIKLTLKAVNMSFLLAYTFGRSEHHNLTFRLLRMTLCYASEERSRFMEEKNAELWMASQWRDPRKAPKLILRTLGESALFAVEIGTFFIQFLEWWYSDDKRARITVNSFQVPPAPHTLKDNRQVQNVLKLLPSDANKCPLCRKTFRNPRVVSVSGVVYCYGCIFPQLKTGSGVCPLTNLPCNMNHLIRIYQ